MAEVCSIEYTDYKKARDTAWEVLISCKVVSLPVDLNIVLEYFGAKAYPYQGNWKRIQAIGLAPAAKRTSGMSFYRGKEPVILYDSSNVPGRIRFTIAHELGHLALGHLLTGEYTVQNREQCSADNPLEKAANHFAVDLLAPACVLWGMNLRTAEEIEAVCGISTIAAQYRAKRMDLLYQRNKFLSSRLEREVYQQFLPFITEWQGLL